ncbi:hypothetical protein HYW54_04065 [Candidatus Gottesmanbacteria bacterium]|nr:hypothetical protein [Candidatus Gottesmanbacteria bacterium]
MAEEPTEEQLDIKKLATATIVGIVVLGAVVYGAYTYSQRKSGNIALPGGVTYLGATPAGDQPPTAPLRFTADPSVSWTIYAGKEYPYSFSTPATLPLVYFPGDRNDPVGVVWGNIPPQANLLLNIERLSEREGDYEKKPKRTYVEDWYKFFSGLSGIESIAEFTNIKGLKGYRVQYLTPTGKSPNIDIFLEIPGRNDIMIHMGNGSLDPSVFDRIVDSVEWGNDISPTTIPPTPSTTP